MGGIRSVVQNADILIALSRNEAYALLHIRKG